MTYDIIGQNYDIIGQNYDIIVSTMISGVPRFQIFFVLQQRIKFLFKFNFPWSLLQSIFLRFGSGSTSCFLIAGHQVRLKSCLDPYKNHSQEAGGDFGGPCLKEQFRMFWMHWETMYNACFSVGRRRAGLKGCKLICQPLRLLSKGYDRRQWLKLGGRGMAKT